MVFLVREHSHGHFAILNQPVWFYVDELDSFPSLFITNWTVVRNRPKNPLELDTPIFQSKSNKTCILLRVHVHVQVGLTVKTWFASLAFEWQLRYLRICFKSKNCAQANTIELSSRLHVFIVHFSPFPNFCFKKKPAGIECVIASNLIFALFQSALTSDWHFTALCSQLRPPTSSLHQIYTLLSFIPHLPNVLDFSFFRTSFKSELFFHLQGNFAFMSVCHCLFFQKLKASGFCITSIGVKTKQGFVLFWRIYGPSQGLSLLICFSHGEHLGDAKWLALLESILRTSVCIIDSENHVERKSRRPSVSISRETNVAPVFTVFKPKAVTNAGRAWTCKSFFAVDQVSNSKEKLFFSHKRRQRWLWWSIHLGQEELFWRRKELFLADNKGNLTLLWHWSIWCWCQKLRNVYPWPIVIAD